MARARLECTIGLHTGAFKRGLAQASAWTRKWIGGSISMFANLAKTVGLAVMGAVAAAGAFLGVLIKKTISAGDTLFDMSKRTGMSTDELQRMQYAAEQTGASMEDVEKGVRLMSKVLLKAGEKSTQAEAALARLGLSAADFVGLNVDQSFLLVMHGLAGIPSAADRAAASMAVFGKSGTKLVSMLADGVGQFDALRAAATRFRLMKPEDIAAAKRAADLITDLRYQFGGIRNAIAGRFLGPLSAAMTEFKRVLDSWMNGAGLDNMVAKINSMVADVAATFEAIAASDAPFATLFDLIVLGCKTGAMLLAQAITMALDKTGMGKIGKWIAAPFEAAAAVGRGLGTTLEGGKGGWERTQEAWNDETSPAQAIELYKKQFERAMNTATGGKWDAIREKWQTRMNKPPATGEWPETLEAGPPSTAEKERRLTAELNAEFKKSKALLKPAAEIGYTDLRKIGGDILSAGKFGQESVARKQLDVMEDQLDVQEKTLDAIEDLDGGEEGGAIF